MNVYFRLLALVLFAGVAGWTYSSTRYPSPLEQRLPIDFGDGQPRIVAIRSYRDPSSNLLGQLIVLDKDSRVLWQGPQTGNDSYPQTFAGWDWSCVELQVAGDIDGDGSVEVVATEPGPANHPTLFHVIRWNGNSFEGVRNKRLVEFPANSGIFRWCSESATSGRWIAKFRSVNPGGRCTVDLWQSRGDDLSTSKATVAPDAQGYHIVYPLKPF